MRLRSSIHTRSLTMKRPFITASGTTTAREVILLRVCAQESCGYGEASPLPGFSQEDAAMAHARLLALQPRLEAYEFSGEVEDVSAFLASAELQDCPSARFAVECALLDLIARRRHISLAHLLKGSQPAARVAVNATISASSAAQCFALGMQAYERGFTCFKLKVAARPLQEDVARVSALRDAIGDAATLRLDANGGWSLAQAHAALDALHPFDIALIEQPVAPSDLVGLATLRARCRIAADESVRSRADLEAVLRAEAADVVVLKPMLIGSLLETLQLQQEALTHGVTTLLTTSLEAAVGRGATLHLAAACDNLEGPCGLATGGLLREDVVEHPLTAEHGFLHLPDSPGAGVVPQLTRGEHAPRGDGLAVPHPLLQRAKFSPTHPALELGSGEVWTYEELAARARHIAQNLAQAGVRSRERVGVIAQNSHALAALLHGISLLGAVAVLIHPGSSQDELAQALAMARPHALVTEQPLPDVSTPTHLLGELARPESKASYPLQERVSLQDIHSIVMTSGTTGQPKLVALTWQNLIFSATGSAIQLGHLPQDRWLAALPLCHVAGLSILMRCAILGTTMVVHERFDAAACARALVEARISMISVVSKMLQDILDALGERRPSPHFRVALVGGGPVPEELVAASARAGLPASPTYGMSEGASQLTTHAPLRPPGGAGTPLIWTECEVRHERIHVRSPTLSPGYVHISPEGHTVARAFTDAAGWFETGDFGTLDEDHRLHILDRRTDRIVSGGENVSAAEVEASLRELDFIEDACVIGLPDQSWGHRVAAVLTLKRPQQPGDLDALQKHCDSRLARFKRPQEFHIWNELPRSALSKVRREQVRKRLLSPQPDTEVSSP